MKIKIASGLQIISVLCALTSFGGWEKPAIAQELSKPTVNPAAVLPNSEYYIPLRFDVLGDGVTQLPLVLNWDLSSGTKLTMSTFEFSNSSFMIGIYQAEQLDTHMRSTFKGNDGKEWMMIARWPKGAFQAGGNIEAIDQSGKVLWQSEIKPADIVDWEKQLGDWKTSLLKANRNLTGINAWPLFNTSLGLRKFDKSGAYFWQAQEPFRLCLSTDMEKGLYTRMCTTLMEVQHPKPDVIKIAPVVRTPSPARVIAFGAQAPLVGQQEVKVGTPVQFYAELSTGSSYEFIAKPIRFNLVEMVDVNNGKQAKILAYGPRPDAEVHEVIIRDERLSIIEKYLGYGWENTLGGRREFWETTIDRSNPVLQIPGEGGGMFRMQFQITKLPREEIRPYLNSSAQYGTYVDGTKLFGKAAKGTKLSSTMNSLDSLKKDDEFLWYFGAKKKGEMNRSYILVNDGENSFRAYRELYKGFPAEISARLTASAGTGGNLIPMGEIAANYWFDSLFGWSNYYVSKLRWGISAKYFQSFSPLVLGSVSDTFTATTIDLKYRFATGLWSRDESWGMEFSSNSINYNVFQNQMFGGGLFWARSMPKVFDDFFNLVPILRYPKAVDMEYIYYPVSTSSNITQNNFGAGYGNWSLNFHGKIMWTTQFFGEAGFGVKQLDFNESFSNNANYSQLRMQFSSFYTTFGMGWSF